MPIFKNPLEQTEDLLALNPENRKATLNKRINYKGNYENQVTGGSHALDNLARIYDQNNVANTMAIANPKGVGADWTLSAIKPHLEGLDNRYENRNGTNVVYSPKTKRGRRLSDIFFQRGAARIAKNPNQLAEEMLPFDDNETIAKINQYEGVK